MLISGLLISALRGRSLLIGALRSRSWRRRRWCLILRLAGIGSGWGGWLGRGLLVSLLLLLLLILLRVKLAPSARIRRGSGRGGRRGLILRNAGQRPGQGKDKNGCRGPCKRFAESRLDFHRRGTSQIHFSCIPSTRGKLLWMGGFRGGALVERNQDGGFRPVGLWLLAIGLWLLVERASALRPKAEGSQEPTG